jgi:hypothetical protein
MLGIAALAAFLGVYLVAVLSGSSRGSRRPKRWIEDCDLDDSPGAQVAEVVVDVACDVLFDDF